MNLNTSSSHFPIDQISNNDHDQHYQLPFAFISDHQVVSSSSLPSQIFFTSSHNNQLDDHTGYYHHHHNQLYNQPHFQDQDNIEKYAYNDRGGSSYEIKNKVNNGLKLTLWKKEEDEGASAEIIKAAADNPVKWMSSKIRLMKKMKHSTNFAAKKPKIEDIDDQKLQPFSSSLESSTDHYLSSNSSSYNNNNSNCPIRVCSDCNTTKTPLWRSGPKGPKSLCNACGIRQRKARRAMAAAAAAASGAVVAADQPPPPVLKIKVQYKEKMGKSGNSPQLKKRCKMDDSAAAAGSSSESGGEKKKIGFEEFLINLSNNLSVHRVFPDEEKDAAILLMALSSGLVHG